MKLLANICVYSLAISIDIMGIAFLVSVIKDAVKNGGK